MQDPETGWTEPEVVINGRTLTFAEAMTLRVAVGNFSLMLADPKTQSLVGVRLAHGYLEHLRTIHASLLQSDT